MQLIGIIITLFGVVAGAVSWMTGNVTPCLQIAVIGVGIGLILNYFSENTL